MTKILLVDINDDLLSDTELPLQRVEPRTLSDEQRQWLMTTLDDSHNCAFDDEEGPLAYYLIDPALISDLMVTLYPLCDQHLDADQRFALGTLLTVINAQL